MKSLTYIMTTSDLYVQTNKEVTCDWRLYDHVRTKKDKCHDATEEEYA